MLTGEEALSGRLLRASEVKIATGHLPAEIGQLKSMPAIEKKGRHWRCNRCNNTDPELFANNFCHCKGPCVYCLKCLNFGKIKMCDQLYYLESMPLFPPSNQSYLDFKGQLSQGQAQAARELVASFKKGRDHLLWAVTGAGKTEMLFPVLDEALRLGAVIGVAAPRIDVINELYPRLQAVFPSVPIQCLHGRSKETYTRKPLTLCSTHQLLRFKAAFDLLIIDEVDAFPFEGDPCFHFAAKRAVKPQGVSIYLTATPKERLKRAAEKGHLGLSILPARYHRQALPVPKLRYIGDWRKALAQGRIPKLLLKQIKTWLNAQQRFLIFLPHIDLMLALEDLLHRALPKVAFTSVSSRDEQRIEKVSAMREAVYQFLLTTAILERGVTFPAIHVLVLGTEDAIYTQAGLVQMSGRVGRKAWAPDGEVYFYHNGKSRAAALAIRQIQMMNHRAKKGGLLDG